MLIKALPICYSDLVTYMTTLAKSQLTMQQSVVPGFLILSVFTTRYTLLHWCLYVMLTVV